MAEVDAKFLRNISCSKWKRELDVVLEKCLTEAEDGKFECLFFRKFEKETIKALEEKGFCIYPRIGEGEYGGETYYTTVKWGEY